MHEILNELSKEMPIFHSEKDFQFALGWKIKEVNPKIGIRFEKRFEIDTKEIHVDLCLETRTQKIPVEIKYKTREVKNKVENFVTKNQGAQDQARYDYVNDISRIENILHKYSQNFGITVMLTNDSSYWRPGRKGTKDEKFRIHEGKVLSGNLDWKKNTSKGTKGGRIEEIKLRRSYKIKWEDYSDLKEKNGKFRYLLTEIQSS